MPQLPRQSALASRERIVTGIAGVTGGVVFRGRMRAAAFGERKVVGARAEQQAWQTVVALEAAGLGVEPVRLVGLPGEVDLDGPRLRPHRRVRDRHGVFERVLVETRPPLDEVQVLTR